MNMIAKTFAILVLLLLPVTTLLSSETSQTWKWFCATFYSSSEDELDTYTRKGKAEVIIREEKLFMHILEINSPEMRIEFKGEINENNKIKGILYGFTFHGPEKWQGKYRETIVEKCIYKEIALRPAIATGAGEVMTFVTKSGACEITVNIDDL